MRRVAALAHFAALLVGAAIPPAGRATPASLGPDDDTAASGSHTIGQRQRELHRAATLPSVDCVRVVVTTTESDAERLEVLRRELLRPWGLERRSRYSLAAPDAEGKAAGCFRAHQRVWREMGAAGCRNMLVLEGDAFFENATAPAGLERAEAFLASGTPYDYLSLGWWNWQDPSQAHPGPSIVSSTSTPCVYSLRHWLNTHAYIISAEAAAAYVQLHYDPHPHPSPPEKPDIDWVLSRHHDRGRFFTVRPMFAFQRHHHFDWAEGNPTLEGMIDDFELTQEADYDLLVTALAHSFEESRYAWSPFANETCS